MKRLAWVAGILLFSQVSSAQLSCSDLFLRDDFKLHSVRADRLPIHVSHEIQETVARHELPLYSERLTKLLAENGGVLTTEALQNFYDSLFFPKVLSQHRLEMARHLSAKNIFAVLGDLSLRETLRLFVGDHHDTVARDSLLGRYLTESGAKLQKRAFTEVGRLAPGQIARTGSERLFVPVDQASYPLFQKYFSNQQTYSVFGHGHLIWQGKLHYQMSALSEQAFAFSARNTPLPMVMLKTTEGQRLARYIKAFQSYPQNGRWGQPDPVAPNFGAQMWDNPARAPWSYVPAMGGGRYIEERGKYSCCGHWQGNIPLGDKLVTEMTLPGPGKDAGSDAPMVVKLHPPDYSDVALAPVKDVWTYPLHEPLSALLGMEKNNGEGEFASAGWAIQSLLVSAPVERVPFVFLLTENAKVDVDPAVLLNFETP